eukprot:3689844-Rhodomonas_salina.4
MASASHHPTVPATGSQQAAEQRQIAYGGGLSRPGVASGACASSGTSFAPPRAPPRVSVAAAAAAPRTSSGARTCRQ